MALGVVAVVAAVCAWAQATTYDQAVAAPCIFCGLFLCALAVGGVGCGKCVRQQRWGEMVVIALIVVLLLALCVAAGVGLFWR